MSKTTPTTRPDLTAKQELCNALCFAALHDSDRVTFVAHDNTQIGDDGLHLTPRGASIMAGNTGRHVVGLFWQKQLSRGHRRPRHQQANRLNDTDNTRRRPSRRTSLPQQQQTPQNHRHYQPSGNRCKDSFPTGGSLQLQHHQPERRGHYWREDSQRGGVTTGERTAREEGSLLERGQPERMGHYWREDSQRGGVTTGERTAREEGSLLERGQPERRGHYWREDSQRGGVTTGEATDRAASRDRGNATTHDVTATTTTTGGTTSPLHINTATAGTGKCDELGSPHPYPPPPPPPPPHSCSN